jgi:arylsulfatase A-like enzyme
MAGVGAMLAMLYAQALWSLTSSAGEMENKFSKLARDEYFGYLVWQNVRVLAAYAILAVAGGAVVWPVVKWWLGRSRRATRFGAVWRGFVLAWLVHGWFLLRLIETRPYFMGEGAYGSWIFLGFAKWPEPLHSWAAGLLFGVLPWLAALGLIAWYGVRGWRGGWLGRAAVATVALGAVAGGAAWRHAHKSVDWKKSGAARSAAPNVLILASDSLRGDRLGFSGYRPGRSDGPAAAGVSPRIDRLAGESFVFEHCFTPVASTLESTTSLMSSQYPHTHGLRHMYPSRAELDAATAEVRPLASVLREDGYDTAAIGDWCAGIYQMLPMGFEDIEVSNFDNFRVYMTQAVFIQHLVVPLYFDNPLGYRMFPEIESFAEFVTPQVVTDRVIRRLDERARDGRPFFWHVFYSCTHLPYRSPEPYCTMFGDPGYSGPNRSSVSFDIDKFIGGTDLEDKWKALPEPEVRQIRALYDGCTRMFDDNVGRILDALRERGLDRNTIVLITGDHGDDMYEPGVTIGHGLGFNGGDQTNHVPFVLHVPGLAARRFPEPVRTLDMAPTLADLAGARIPTNWEGRDLAGWLKGGASPEPLPFYAETAFPFVQFKVKGIERLKLPPMDESVVVDKSMDYQFVLKPEIKPRLIAAKERCLRTANWKLIRTPTADGGRFYRLYHISEDPHCLEDVKANRPEVLAAMSRALEAWIARREETPIPEIFPGGEPE